MALTQIVELQIENSLIVYTSEAETSEAVSHLDKLKKHRIDGGVGRYSIGHYSSHGNFIVPNDVQLKAVLGPLFSLVTRTYKINLFALLYTVCYTMYVSDSFFRKDYPND